MNVGVDSDNLSLGCSLCGGRAGSRRWGCKASLRAILPHLLCPSFFLNVVFRSHQMHTQAPKFNPLHCFYCIFVRLLITFLENSMPSWVPAYPVYREYFVLLTNFVSILHFLHQKWRSLSCHVSGFSFPKYLEMGFKQRLPYLWELCSFTFLSWSQQLLNVA